MKISLDLHGVIDSDPKFFAVFTETLYRQRCEIHVVTGQEISVELTKQLKNYGIIYDHLFSITSYHKVIGSTVKYKDGNLLHPLIDPKLWDPTKAEYCRNENINVHIDDSRHYGKYFIYNTKYVKYDDKIKKLLELVIYCNLWR